jgi:hypothetical protein
MNKPIEARDSAYGVWADHSTLNRESLGPLFVRATIELRGAIDMRWRSSYGSVRGDAEGFSRFNLDPKGNTISFTFRPSEQASEVYGLLQRLELLIELTNLHATAAVALPRRQTGA